MIMIKNNAVAAAVANLNVITNLTEDTEIDTLATLAITELMNEFGAEAEAKRAKLTKYYHVEYEYQFKGESLCESNVITDKEVYKYANFNLVSLELVTKEYYDNYKRCYATTDYKEDTPTVIDDYPLPIAEALGLLNGMLADDECTQDAEIRQVMDILESNYDLEVLFHGKN